MNTRIKVKKGILPKSKKWYCGYCDKFTKSIKSKSGLMKCLQCGRKHYFDGWSCPKCGAEIIENDVYCTIGKCPCTNNSEDINCRECIYFNHEGGTLTNISNNHFVSTMDYSGYEWIETHKCWHCGTIYEFLNSSF